MRRHPSIEVLASRALIEAPVFRVVAESIRLPSGLKQELVLVDHPGAVCVAALCDTGELILVRQYRHAAGEWMLELPAGRLEPGETGEEAARRELEEETGHRAREWRRVVEFLPAPGISSERLTLFLARGLEPVQQGRRPCDADEELELVRLPPAELLEGATSDAKTLLAAALLVLRRIPGEGLPG